MNEQSAGIIKVWDILVRSFHWSLVFFFFLAYIIENDFPIMHSYAGYTVFLLVSFRVLWGFIGSPYARFSEFTPTPGNVLDYLKQIAHGKAERYIGHNPAGSIMIFALLLSLPTTAFLGMSLIAVEGSGPFAETFISNWSGPILQAMHEIFANISLLLIILHFLGVLHSSVLHRENLVKSMITGNKKHLFPTNKVNRCSGHKIR